MARGVGLLMRRVMVIAEFGSNILPATPARMRLFCREARRAGADAGKIQLFLASHFPESEHGEKQRAEFPRERLPEFIEIAKDEGLLVGASVFDIAALALLQMAGADFVKLASREENNAPLLLACRRSGLPLIRSVVWGVRTQFMPHSGEMTLACIPEYPTREDHPGLANMNTLPLFLPEPYGWSSHTLGWRDVVEAVQMGATVIEKHMKLSPTDPEAAWSLFPEEFGRMVEDIREAEKRRLM